MTLNASDVAALFGQPKPVKHRQRVCAVCESIDDFIWADEIEGLGASPIGTGYSILMCASCGEVVPDDGTKETKRWVGF